MKKLLATVATIAMLSATAAFAAAPMDPAPVETPAVDSAKSDAPAKTTKKHHAKKGTHKAKAKAKAKKDAAAAPAPAGDAK